MLSTEVIDRIIATEVIVPARKHAVDRPEFGASLFDQKSKWMIEIFTSGGLVGYGESRRGASRASMERSANHLLGKPLHSLAWNCPVPPDLSADSAWGHATPPVPHRFHEMDFTSLDGDFGYSVAILDLWAKSLQVPLHRFLGGSVRDAVPTSWWFGRSDPAHAAQQMQIGLAHGFTSVKIKVTADDDVEGIVRAIKEVAGPETLIVIDPNGRFYRRSEALKIARRLERYPNIILEDPFPFEIREWQLFRAQTSLPLALHKGDWVLGAREHACDYVNLGFPVHRFLGNARAAFLMGLLCWHGSGVELGVLDSYMLHASAVAPNCALPGDAMGHRIRESSLIEEELAVANGAIEVPQGPGLGVTLDRAALRHYTKEKIEWKP
ncbi:MAG TPA: mandelate racemase/muconate lactonizing enzyme family protein [Chthoniobacteraceae bacterium]|nr:mandelate racemase/muconate lactonizing enzyme family protein [Chthoniobacteraceae bacterium]